MVSLWGAAIILPITFIINSLVSAASTILFGNFNIIGRSVFALGVVSLLSSLISIGFGVGLTYVLGDVQGPTLHVSILALSHSILNPLRHQRRPSELSTPGHSLLH